MYVYPGLTEKEVQGVIHNAPCDYGAIESNYLLKIDHVLGNALSQFPRVMAIRVDLRFVKNDCVDMPPCFQDSDGLVVKRFIESLNSQLCALENRRRNQGGRVYPNKVRYVWVREQNDSVNQHYHFVLFFNKDAYCRLGDVNHENSLANKINKAWLSAIRLPCWASSGLVHFSKNGCYWITRDDAQLRSPDYAAFIKRVVYLAKVDTKVWGEGHRCIGSSRG
ncbi:inovirus Gp2 family protein [Pseudaeromonas paramecii]|uniref:Inovirus Gp2 family protein n=1 Tax=Pseudaeromonas paramecii TaxID=2138166 RepID=A0ABP8QAB5_9GAMM